MYQIFENGQRIGSGFDRYETALSTFLSLTCVGAPESRPKGLFVLARIFELGQSVAMARAEDGTLTYLASYFG